MKYIIEEYVLNEFNASSKAREDVSRFVLENGFKSFAKNDKRHIRHSKSAKFLLALSLLCKIFTLGREDFLFLQTSEKLLKPILWIKKLRGFKVIYLIHDMFCMAFDTPESIAAHQNEIRKKVSILSNCDCVITHNERMTARFKERDCTTSFVELSIFDYHTKEHTPIRKLEGKPKVAFAGNLSKSPFLNKLDESSHSYDLIVYGAPTTTYKNNIYKGCVEPDILPKVIEGHFGLIWEGAYEVSLQNNYNRINNPHKLSMYIVAGLPIIAWKGSYAAKFAEEHKIGFGIDSLDELDAILEQITPEEYNSHVQHCQELSEQLKTGKHLRTAISKVNSVLE